MSDPYSNADVYAPPQAQVADVATTETSEAIERLDVSGKWKRRFRVIARAGGPGLPQIKQLSTKDRRIAQINVLAFLFGPFYFLAKGLWRQAVVFLGIAFACVLVLEMLRLGAASQGAGIGLAVAYALRANVSYYQRMVLKSPPWL